MAIPKIFAARSKIHQDFLALIVLRENVERECWERGHPADEGLLRSISLLDLRIGGNASECHNYVFGKWDLAQRRETMARRLHADKKGKLPLPKKLKILYMPFLRAGRFNGHLIHQIIYASFAWGKRVTYFSKYFSKYFTPLSQV